MEVNKPEAEKEFGGAMCCSNGSGSTLILKTKKG
jgi:hypothetical protein